MTVIAWDGKTLAADKRATTEWGARGITTKIERFPGGLMAATGDASVSRSLRAWFAAGAETEKFPKMAEGDKSALIVITALGVDVYTTGPHPVRYEQEKQAFGSGRDYAEAALLCGKTAREAVEVACQLNVFCGDGIDTLEFEP